MAWSQSRILCRRSVFLRVLHDDVCLLLQVETRTALSNLEAIAEIDGVDGIFIGPNRPGGRHGTSRKLAASEVWKVMEDAAKRIRNVGKAPGILVGEADAKRCIDMGYLFVAVGSDLVMLARGADALAAKFK
jgi:4-hydroxy-2-oxoheptanedioate aldolase